MTTALVRRKQPLGLEYERRLINRVEHMTIFIKRGATNKNHIKHIDREAMKRYIESEGYGE